MELSRCLVITWYLSDGADEGHGNRQSGLPASRPCSELGNSRMQDSSASVSTSLFGVPHFRWFLRLSCAECNSKYK